MSGTMRTSPFSRKIPDLRNSFTRIATAPGPDKLLHVNRSSPHRVRQVRVVAIGGGTGLSLLLPGLKKHVAPPPRRDSHHPPGDPAAGVAGAELGAPAPRFRRAYS